MKKILMCSMLIAATLPSVAIAAPAKARVEQSTCRVVSMKIIRTISGETEIEYTVRCTTSNGVT